ncbi:MAG: acyl carrier protein [Stackebrandtia sp.]
MNREAAMWTKVLAGIEADSLDCLQANLAVLADQFHGARTHLRLGARLAFAPSFDAPLPTVDPGLDGRLSEAAAVLGLRARQRADLLDGAQLLRRIAQDGPLYVVADAHKLPWTPYFRRRHIDHSFLLLSDAVVDAYHIDTPEGSARPARLPLDEAAISPLTAAAARIEPCALEPLEHIGVTAPDPATIDAYVAAYRDAADRVEALEQLTAEIWLLARARRLHARWAPDQRAAAHADAWSQLSDAVYLAKRRVERGRAEPPAWPQQLSRLLHAEIGLAGPPGAVDRARQAVVSVAAQVLDVDADKLAAAASLADFPMFNSFRTVDIVEQVEQELATELPPDTMVAENLHYLDKLAVLFARGASDGRRDD